MASSGDLRSDTSRAQEKRDRIRAAANQIVADLDTIEADLTPFTTFPQTALGHHSTAATEAHASLRLNVQRLMLLSGVRQVGPMSYKGTAQPS